MPFSLLRPMRVQARSDYEGHVPPVICLFAPSKTAENCLQVFEIKDG